MTAQQLSENEVRALEILQDSGGSLLVSKIPDKNERDVFGSITPGHSVYAKLAKRDLCFYSEEQPLDLPGDPLDGFTFTPEVYITDEGREAIGKPVSTPAPRC